MAYDGKILARSREILRDRKQRNEHEHQDRQTKIFIEFPQIKKASDDIANMMSALAISSLQKGGGVKEAISEKRGEIQRILAYQDALLVQAGFPKDYLEPIYSCQLCHDLGYVEGRTCDCLKKIYRDETVKELSQILDLGGQSFEKFNLDYYDDVFLPLLNQNPRTAMERIFNNCLRYADTFGEKSVSLLFRGNTGLGKTFLSASIAKRVSEKGFSVVYDTAISILEAFETQKFSREGELFDLACSKVKRYLGCDLLILDDLGTEMVTSFTQSALYTLVNSRMVDNKKTIISTNLEIEEMRRRYSSQVVSRIEGEYMALNFVGNDVRSIKKTR